MQLAVQMIVRLPLQVVYKTFEGQLMTEIFVVMGIKDLHKKYLKQYQQELQQKPLCELNQNVLHRRPLVT